MGKKKSSLFTAIKRIFSSKSETHKNKGKGILGEGENRSFIRLFRAPSSIEKILVEADQLNIRPPVSLQSPKTLQGHISQVSAAVSPETCSPSNPHPGTHPLEVNNEHPSIDPAAETRDEVCCVTTKAASTARDEDSSAVKIQAAYRGYLARRTARASDGISRLQGVMRGPNVRRQTMSALKQMQLLVRVQRQVQSQRVQMLENQAFQQAFRAENDVDSSLSRRTLNQLLSETGRNEVWDDSLLTKEEEEVRLHRKVEAVIKRERAMAYAYSHKLWKSNTKSEPVPLDWRFNGFPWWSNWNNHQLPAADISQSQNTAESTTSTPLKASTVHPRCASIDSATPRLSMAARSKKLASRESPMNSGFGTPSFKDNASLMSCPVFARPHYMTPTVSAMGKYRAISNPKERFSGTPDSKRRFSLPFLQNKGEFVLNRGSSNRDSSSQTGSQKYESPRSVGSSAVNSAVSLPAFVGRRKAFDRRFV